MTKSNRKSENDIPDYYLNKRQMSDSLGISTIAFDKYKLEPVMVHNRITYYSVRQVVDNRVHAERIKLGKESKPAPQLPNGLVPAEEKARLDKERADYQAIKNEIARGESIPIEAATYVFGQIGSHIASVLDTLPVKIKRRLPGIKSSQLDMVRKEIAKAQNAAADVDKVLHEFIEEYNDGAIVETEISDQAGAKKP